MRHSRLAKPGSIANVQIEIQIVDTHESLKTVINNGFTASKTQFNRTLLTKHPKQNGVTALNTIGFLNLSQRLLPHSTSIPANRRWNCHQV
jgi:hypothetical protein